MPPAHQKSQDHYLSSASINFRDHIRKETQERKCQLLHLIFNYLIEHNYQQTAEALLNESHINTNEYTVCDNINLDIVLQEFHSYYTFKFQKAPKFIRKLESNTNGNDNNNTSRKTRKTTNYKSPSVATISNKSDDVQSKNDPVELSVDIVPLLNSSKNNNDLIPIGENDDFGLDLRNQSVEFATHLSREILSRNLQVTFKDCIGLQNVIELLKEAIIYPRLYPVLFDNVVPWRGVLLYGPPGTGKTFLAKALATESQSLMLNLTSSTFTSKWRGESEKLVRSLFELARNNPPATIFIDELDALVSQTMDSQHEASRRFKSELLTQIDGINTKDQHDIFVLATTNSPWNIDPALLRRFEKRIYVQLPNDENRCEILRYYLQKNGYSFDNRAMEILVKKTVHFSAAEIQVICKELKMVLIREVIRNGQDINKSISRRPNIEDLLLIIEKTRPCIDNCNRYQEWTNKFAAM